MVRDSASAASRVGWRQALATLAQLRPAGLRPSPRSASAGARAWASAAAHSSDSGLWRCAVGLLWELQEASVQLDVACLNAAASASAAAGCWAKALDLLLNDGPSSGLAPSAVTRLTAVGACGAAKKWAWASWLLCHMPLAGPSDTAGCNAAISACERSACWQPALALLQAMRRSRGSPDLISCNAASSACAKGLQWEQAFQQLFSLVACWRLEADVITYSAAISAQPWERSVRVMQKLCQDGLRFDIVACNAGMSACGSSRRWELSLGLLGEARRQDLRPDLVSCGAAISAAGAGGGQWEKVLLLWQSLSRPHGRDDLQRQSLHRQGRLQVALNAALSSCEAVGEWAWALFLLREAQRGSLPPDVVSFAAVVSACARGVRCPRPLALALLGEAKHRGLKLDLVAYNSALAALSGGTNNKNSNNNSWRLALQLLQELRLEGHLPDSVGINAVLGAVAGSGGGSQWAEALVLLGEMPAFHLQPDALTCAICVTAFEGGAALQRGLLERLQHQAVTALLR
ncbi:unnamed protein product [Polarella glacialis]|uniref:Pentatricopeptide repeat-containing protein, chloroplastic n=1 Tax=Polarella glacialis TaxID=89957 RepID=A0A813L596_POLGL|nr:unnamed protein product [Polarella glacialis]